MSEYTEEQVRVIRAMAAAFPSSRLVAWIEGDRIERKHVPTLDDIEVLIDKRYTNFKRFIHHGDGPGVRVGRRVVPLPLYRMVHLLKVMG